VNLEVQEYLKTKMMAKVLESLNLNMQFIRMKVAGKMVHIMNMKNSKHQFIPYKLAITKESCHSHFKTAIIG
jgi:hypothetical protein